METASNIPTKAAVPILQVRTLAGGQQIKPQGLQDD